MARQRKSNPTAILDQHQFDLKGSMRLSLLLGVIQTLCTIGFAYWVALLIDQVLTQGSLDHSPLLLVAAAFLILAVKAAASLWQSTINLRNSVTIRDRLREQILSLSFKTGISLFPAFKPAQLANLLTSEVDKLKEYYAEFKIQKQMAVWTPVLILIAASFVNWLVPLILLLTTPLIPIFMIIVGNKAGEASRNNLEQLNRLGHLLEDRLRNVDLLQQERAVDRETEALHHQSDQFRISTMKVLRLAFLSGTLLEFFAAISVALVAVYLGLFFLDKYSLGAWGTDISFAEGAFLLMLAPEYYLPLRKMGALYHAKSNARAVAEQIEQLKQAAEPSSVGSEASQAGSFKASIKIEGLVSGSDQAIHKPVSVELKAGESLLIEAPSGTGKTSLLDTLAGLRPPLSGAVSADEITIEPYNNPHWQQTIGYITQHPELIYGSLRENLCLGKSYSDDDIWAALGSAQLETVVKQLPQGLDYFITDSGHFLSGGQTQRLSIARALLHRPKLLLLDEPVANLDVDTAELFMNALNQYVEQGGMIIMASHRTNRFNFTQRLTLAKAEVEA
ncbi:thiol reductant ABC exporter subunit CydD [Marinobacterium sp. xm-d-579]|uniref:thiol reductant ABC exporter subunit CydD n=1 Tax=Marinobacterium sp. xm-d-579 TaxID=2497734 RepID=UPI0015686145|nr:thiol reductant ABC exporter subunit CydD [Marinobacterium sp. xm-d-579]